MHHSFLLRACAAMAAFCAAAVAETTLYTTYYVLADLALIRRQPRAEAPPAGGLRTGTQFPSNRTSGDWIFVDSAHEQRVHGWVHSSTCTQERVDSAYLVKHLRQAATLADSLLWYQRMLSLSSRNQAVLQALEKGFLAIGDTARSQTYGRRLRGTDPTFIAMRKGKHIRLLGSIDSTGAFRSLLWREWQVNAPKEGQWIPTDEADRRTRRTARELAPGLAALDWYHGIWAEGEHFIAPRVIPEDKDLDAGQVEERRNEPGEFFADFDGAVTFGLSLQRLSRDRGGHRLPTLYATKPIFPVATRGIRSRAEHDSLHVFTRRLVGDAFDKDGIAATHFRSLPEYGYIDVTIRGNTESIGFIRQQRGIFDAKRRLVWPPEGHTFMDIHAEYEEDGWNDIRTLDHTLTGLTTDWFRFGPDSTHSAFTITPFSSHYSIPSFEAHNGSFGLQLVRIGRNGRNDSKTYTIRSEYAGD